MAWLYHKIFDTHKELVAQRIRVPQVFEDMWNCHLSVFLSHVSEVNVTHMIRIS